jgi:predicted metal-dependent hydrolase
MSTSTYHLAVGGLQVEVESKPIKNLYVGVYPPEGQVRVAAPRALSKDAVRLAIVDRLSWIKRQRAKFRAQDRQTARQVVSGETHYFLGRRYRLRVFERSGPTEILVKSNSTIHLFVKPGTSESRRVKLLQDWYRAQLKALVAGMISDWERSVGVGETEFRIRRMKTKWGSCSRQRARICLNLELAKKPIECIEYVLVHELVHVIQRHHNEHFVSLMDRVMPNWRSFRDLLNSGPLAHEDWSL